MKFKTYVMRSPKYPNPVIAVTMDSNEVYSYYTTPTRHISVKALRTIAAGFNIGDGKWRINASKEQLLTKVNETIEMRHTHGRIVNFLEEDKHESASGRVIKNAIDARTGEPTPTPEQTPTPQPESEDTMGEGVFEKAIQAAISGELSKKLDSLEQRLKDNTTKEIVIKRAEEEPMHIGKQHKAFPQILGEVNIGHGVFLTGPAGSGKTTLAANIAKALKLDFGCLSVCSQTTATAFIGYRNAVGDYVSTDFRRIFEHGGVFLLDEIDAGNPNVVALMNSALDNALCAFPDGIITAHKDFRIIVSGNTFGTGADSMYVGRNRLDGATLSRFSSIMVDYDEEFERMLSGNLEWCNYVITVRKAVAELQLNRLITPRASIKGARSLKAGASKKDVENMHVWKGMPEEEIRKIKNHIREAKHKEGDQA